MTKKISLNARKNAEDIIRKMRKHDQRPTRAYGRRSWSSLESSPSLPRWWRKTCVTSIVLTTNSWLTCFSLNYPHSAKITFTNTEPDRENAWLP